MLKGVLFVSLMVIGIQSTLAQRYSPADSSSSVKFKIKNLGVTITGSFMGVDGNLIFDPGNPSSSSFEASIDVTSINTGIDMRDEHLRKEEYFDAKNYPRIKFVSTKVSSSNKPGAFKIVGNLTIKNVTKEISFPFTATAEGTGYLFSGEFRINRRDFKVGGNSFTMADNLIVQLSILAQKDDR